MKPYIQHTYKIALLAFLFLACTRDDSLGPDINDIGITLTTETEVTDGKGNTYKVGYDQVSSNNQDPFVEKLDANGNRLWRHRYEESPVDGRAVLIALDEEDVPYVVFTVDGGSNSDAYINRHRILEGAFQGVFQSGYGMGGGPKVSILARLEPASGLIQRGSFITARLNNGNTNSLTITELGFTDDRVGFRVSSAAWPPGEGSSYSRFPDIDDSDRVNNSFLIYYEMDKNLEEISRALLLRE